MKKIIITAALAFFCATTFAQYKHWNEEKQQHEQYNSYEEYVIEKAEFIFEGEVIENVFFQYDDGTGYPKIYTSSTMQINKIVKGGDKIKLGTITFIEKGGMGKNGVILKQDWYGAGSKGLFFCTTSDHPTTGEITWICDTKNGYSEDVSSASITPNADNSVIITMLHPMGFGEGKKFKTKQELYNYLHKQGHKTIEKENKKIEEEPVKKKDTSGSLDVISKENQIKYAQNVQNYERYMEFLQSRIVIVANKTGNNCKELFISEMIEGTAQNRALELFNPSDTAIDLSNFSIRIFLNGQLTPLIIPLSGILPPKSTFVIAHPASKPDIKAKADMLDPQMTFDGNDAIVLEKTGGTQIDKIGEIGVNPGNSGWTCTNGSTKDYTLRRKASIGKGELDWQQCRQQWTDHPKDNSSNLKQHQSVCGSTALDEISFSFANAVETGVSPKFLEFDIEVSTNASGTYYDNTVLSIQYNTTAFGTNVVANGKITITKGANFNSITYIDANTVMIDDATNEVRIPFGTDPVEDGNLNRTLIDAIPQQLFHVKMEIQTCNTNSQLLFVNTFFAEFFSAYTLNPTDSINAILFYDDALFPTNQLNNLLCVPNITSFTSPVYPGTFYQGTTDTDYLMTIQGTNFGGTQGNGNVYFLNADDGGQSYISLNDYDSIIWSDNEIQIIMPSVINILPLPLFEAATPGSGIFYVKTNSGDSVLSSTPVDMPYAIKNAFFSTLPEKKVRMDLMNNEVIDSVAIEFRLSTSITNHSNPMVEAIARRAIEDWACLTGAWFEIGPETTISSTSPDGVSVVHFVSSFTDPTTLAETEMHQATLGICEDFSGNKHVWPTEIDIAILLDPTTIGAAPWHFDTINALPAGKTDFFEVTLHEVGHAVLLGHVNYDDLMFYKPLFDPADSIPEFSRRYISAIDQTAGINVVVKGAGVTLDLSTCGGTDVGTLIILPADQSCVNLVSAKGLSRTNSSFINTYPNPAGNQGFNISYELTNKSFVQFRLIDYTGKQILLIDNGYLPAGKHKEQINTNQLTSGFYFLVANIGGNVQTKKIIKL